MGELFLSCTLGFLPPPSIPFNALNVTKYLLFADFVPLKKGHLRENSGLWFQGIRPFKVERGSLKVTIRFSVFLDLNHALSPYCKCYGFMIKDTLTFIFYFSSVLAQCNTSTVQAVTSLAENREPLKRVSIVIIPKYLFETNGIRIN